MAAAILLGSLSVGTSLAKATPDQIPKIIALLRSPDEDVQRDGRDRLDALSEQILDDGMIEALLEAATERFPEPKIYEAGIAASLVHALENQASPLVVDGIASRFPRFDQWAQNAAIELLLGLDVDGAVERMVELYCSESVKAPIEFPFKADRVLPNHPDIQLRHLDRMLDCAKSDEATTNLLLATQIKIASGRFSRTELLGVREKTVRMFEPAWTAVLAEQKPANQSFLWGETYWHLRRRAGILLEMFSYYDDPESLAALKRSLEQQDRRLCMHGVLALSYRGELVAREHIDFAAGDPEARAWLFDGLNKLGKVQLMSERHRSQAALAEADMARWLSFPTEYAQPPDEIELVGSVPVGAAKGHTDLTFYVFRFRAFAPHWSAGKGWDTGVAGPYRRRELAAFAPNTFSNSTEWKGQSAAEILQTYIGDPSQFDPEVP